ncbi:MAG: hypothetical protein IKM97_01460 [Clostridia bacterium]|nr:hypothetical protein [Clostridia bacterium]
MNVYDLGSHIKELELLLQLMKNNDDVTPKDSMSSINKDFDSFFGSTATSTISVDTLQEKLSKVKNNYNLLQNYTKHQRKYHELLNNIIRDLTEIEMQINFQVSNGKQLAIALQNEVQGIINNCR